MAGYIAVRLCAIITFGMALLQLSLTFGAPFGEYVLGGNHKVLPRKMRYVSCAFSLIFFLVTMAYLQKGKVIDIRMNHTFVNVILIVNTIFLGYAIVGNGFLTHSKKEKYLMTPISIVQFILSIVALLYY